MFTVDLFWIPEVLYSCLICDVITKYGVWDVLKVHLNLQEDRYKIFCEYFIINLPWHSLWLDHWSCCTVFCRCREHCSGSGWQNQQVQDNPFKIIVTIYKYHSDTTIS